MSGSLAVECNVLASALNALLKRYVDLANSGDAGHWDPEQEPVVQGARAALIAASAARGGQ